MKDYTPNLPSEEGNTQFNSQLLAPLLLPNPLPIIVESVNDVRTYNRGAKKGRTDFLDVSWLTGPPFASLVVNRVKDLVCSLSVNYSLPCLLFFPIFLPQIFTSSKFPHNGWRWTITGKSNLHCYMSFENSLPCRKEYYSSGGIDEGGEVGRILTIPAPTFSPSSWTNTRRTANRRRI